MVRFLSGLADWVLVGCFGWEDVDLDLDLAVDCLFTGLALFEFHVEPELLAVLRVKLDVRESVRLLELIVEVLIETHWPLD